MPEVPPITNALMYGMFRAVILAYSADFLKIKKAFATDFEKLRERLMWCQRMHAGNLEASKVLSFAVALLTACRDAFLSADDEGNFIQPPLPCAEEFSRYNAGTKPRPMTMKILACCPDPQHKQAELMAAAEFLECDESFHYPFLEEEETGYWADY